MGVTNVFWRAMCQHYAHYGDIWAVCKNQTVSTCTNIVKASFVNRLLTWMFEHSQNKGLYARFSATGSLEVNWNLMQRQHLIAPTFLWMPYTVLLSNTKLGPLGSFAFLSCWSKYIMVVSININRLNSVKRSTVFDWSWESIKCIYMFSSVITVNFHINP